MHRTQIYLPDDQYCELQRLSREREQSLAELIRRALARYLQEEQSVDVLRLLRESFGVWRDRTDLPSTQEYVRELRQGWSSRP